LHGHHVALLVTFGLIACCRASKVPRFDHLSMNGHQVSKTPSCDETGLEFA